ncbi:hypothetical protein DID73_02260, partial [Candidatus Marinamargulisbacteria bacterium SCGC AG-343-K17]
MSQFKIIPLNTAQIPSLEELSLKQTFDTLKKHIEYIHNTEQLTEQDKKKHSIMIITWCKQLVTTQKPAIQSALLAFQKESFFEKFLRNLDLSILDVTTPAVSADHTHEASAADQEDCVVADSGDDCAAGDIKPELLNSNFLVYLNLKDFEQKGFVKLLNHNKHSLFMLNLVGVRIVNLKFIKFLLKNTSVKQIDFEHASLTEVILQTLLQSDSLEKINLSGVDLQGVTITKLGQNIKDIDLSGAKNVSKET